jgi:hypothetical protein
MKSPHEPDLELRGKLIRSLGAYREMLPGSFVKRMHAAADLPVIARLHRQYQISVLMDGKPKAINIPARLAEKVRAKIEMRRRFDTAATTICLVNLKRFLQEKLEKKDPQD